MFEGFRGIPGLIRWNCKMSTVSGVPEIRSRVFLGCVGLIKGPPETKAHVMAPRSKRLRVYRPQSLLGYCPHPVTVATRDRIKGYIYLHY